MDVAAQRFWELVEEHRDPLWRFALGLTRSREDARDLVSETVLAAHRSFGKLRDERAFRSSLFTIAVRLHRRRTWRSRIFGRIEEAEHATTDPSPASAHDIELLLNALGKLPEKQREAILLFEFSGLSIREITNVQGGTESGVKARLVRAREALKVALDDNTPPARDQQRSFDSMHHGSLLGAISTRLDLKKL